MRNFTRISFFIALSLSGYVSFGQSPVTLASFNGCIVTGDVSWTNPGTVNTLLVFVKQSATPITVGSPAANIATYITASNDLTSLGTAYENDAAAHLVYKNTSGNTVGLIGMTAGTTYQFLIFNANGTTYSTAVTFTSATLTIPNDAGSFAAGSITNSGLTLSWTDPTPSNCFDEILIVGKASAAVAGTPAGNGSAYTGTLSFTGAAAPDFDAGAKTLYKGPNATPGITSLTGNTPYHFKIFTRKASVWSTGVEIIATTNPDPASAGSLTSTCITTGTVGWTNPVSTVSTILVFAKAGSAITTSAPTANVSTYTANTSVASGTPYQEDAAAHCVYKGTSNSVNLTSLGLGTNYYFVIYNVNGTVYSPPLAFNGTAASVVPPPTGIGFVPADGSIDVSWSNPTCSDNVLIVVKQAGAIGGTPSGSSYSFNTNFGSASNGTGFAVGEKAVYFGTSSPQTISGLTDGITYNFAIYNVKGSTWSTALTGTSVPVDLTPPTVNLATGLTPADGSTSVLLNTTLLIDFSEVTVAETGSYAAGATQEIRIYKDNNPGIGTFQTIPRNSGSITFPTTTQAQIAISALILGGQYHVEIGNLVFRDPSNNYYAGFTNSTSWNFTATNGVTTTPGTASACQAIYSTISDITLTEDGNDDINQGASPPNTYSFTLGISGPGSEYVFKPGTGTVSFTAAKNITAASIVVDFTTVKVTYTVNGNNKGDAIKIHGVQISTSNSLNATRNIIRIANASGTEALIDGFSAAAVAGSVSSGSASPTPGAPIFSPAAPAGIYCKGTNISAITVSVSGTAIKWYSDAALTNSVGTGSPIAIKAGLGVDETTPGVYTYYATQTSTGCESATPRTVTITIRDAPVVDAGLDHTLGSSICATTSVTLGGLPTITHTTTGPYTYNWTGSGSPAAVGNPVVTPVDPGASDATYGYSLFITDNFGCTSNTDNVQVTVLNISQQVTFTKPPSFYFTIYDAPQDLAGSPSTNSSFSGQGVILTGTGYKFDPKAAGVSSGPGWPVTYTTQLTNGCYKTISQPFNVSNFDVFPGFTTDYCNDEGLLDLQISSTTIQDMLSYVNYWNANYLIYGYGALKVTFSGVVRNIYEGAPAYGYYGPNNSVVKSGTYFDSGSGLTLGHYYLDPTKLSTLNGAYPGCADCYNVYPAAFIEFVDVNSTYPYNVPIGSDYGYSYNNGLTAGFAYTGEFANIHPVPYVNFTGINNSDILCNVNTNIQLTGNTTAGLFEVALDAPSGWSSGSNGISITTGGKATFNPATAFGGSATSRTVYIRYTLDPGTTSVTARGECKGVFQISFTIFDSPVVTWDPVTNADMTPYCYTQPQKLIKTSQSTNVTFSGNGVADNGNSTAFFLPQLAFDTQTPGATVQTTVVVTATIVSPQGCISTLTRSFVVYPPPTASFTNSRGTLFDLCYNDVAITSSTFTAAENNSTFDLTYVDAVPAVPPFHFADLNTSTKSTFVFNQQARFDDAVNTYHANGLSDLRFLLVYTSFDGNNCTATYQKLITVSPKIDVSITGITDGEEYCSNEGARTLTLTPNGGTFKFNNLPTATIPGVGFDTFILDKPSGTGGNVPVYYEKISGVANCVNSLTKTINILPSPVSDFNNGNQCFGIPFVLTSANNSGVVSWVWNMDDGTPIHTGYDTATHFYPKPTIGQSRIFNVGLKTSFAPAGASNLVCVSDITKPVNVGIIPTATFSFSSICEGDITSFVSAADVGLTNLSWKFGDGESTSLGAANASAVGSPTVSLTGGTYGQPTHKFSGNGNFSIEMIGKSALGCPDTVTRVVKMLKNLVPTITSPYVMADADSAIWKTEDVSDSLRSTWVFDFPNKPVFNSPTERYWVTDKSLPYKSKDNSYVNSPCFDLSDFTRPAISIDYWINTDKGGADGAVLQYSVNGGATWITLGNTADGLSWYNATNISAAPGGQIAYGWAGNTLPLPQAGKHSLDAVLGQTKVRFRVAFGSYSRNLDGNDGFAFRNIKIEERNRFTLVESFTNSEASIATAVTNNMNAFNAISSSEVVKIEYHTGFPDTHDPINLLNPADPNARSAFYGLTTTSASMPRGFIDGLSQGTLDQTWAIDYRPLRSLVTSSFVVTPGNPVTTDPTKITVTANIKATGDIPASNLVVYIALVEKVVGSEQYVLRKMVPSAAGTLLPTPMVNGTTFDVTPDPIVVDNVLDFSKLAVVAFIQNQQPALVQGQAIKEVMQSALLDAPLANLPSVTTGTYEPLSGIRIFPNPSNTECRIQLPGAARQQTTLKLYDQLGKIVRESTIPPGSSTKDVNTHDLAGGLYIMNVDSGDGILTRVKLLVVHTD